MEKVKEMMETKIMTSGKQLDTIVYPQTNHTIVYLDVFFCGRHLEDFWKFHSWKIKSKRKKLKKQKNVEQKSNVDTIVYPGHYCVSW